MNMKIQYKFSDPAQFPFSNTNDLLTNYWKVITTASSGFACTIFFWEVCGLLDFLSVDEDKINT